METRHGNGKTIGILIAIGALLIIVGQLIHPPEGTLDETFATTAAQASAWRLSHAVLGVAAICLTSAAALALTGPRPARGGPGPLGTALVLVGGVLTLGFLAIEATAAPDAAVAGDREQWNVYNGATLALIVYGFVPFLAGLTLLAAHEIFSPERATRRWAGIVGAVAGAVAIVGHLGAYAFGSQALAPLAYAALPLFAYIVWLGIGLARGKGHAPMADPAQAVA